MNCENASFPQNRAGHAPENSPRILVAIEYPVEALAVESLLRGENYPNVRVTTDVREIALMFVRWPFHLLILDMHSKLKDSASVMQELAHPINASDLRVLALTNPGAEQERLAALAAGAIDTLSRPLDHENAMPTVRRALSIGQIGLSTF